MKASFSKEQLDLLNKIGFDFKLTGKLDEDEIFEIDDKVAEYLMEYGIGEDDSVNEVGKLCESILELLSDL